MTNPLRVGVIGLGPRWRRQYRPALGSLREQFEISAVCDQVHERAARAAKRLGCAAAGGPTDLLERKDVDALLLLDAQWHGLWAAELACRAGKPAFCCPPAALAADEGESVRRQADASRVPVMLALPLRVLPAAARLRELLAGALGQPQLVLGCAGATAAGTELSLLDLLDWSATLFAAPATPVTRVVTPALSSVVLEYGTGRSAQLTTYRAPAPAGPVRLEVIAERGRAVLQTPDRLSWADAEGRHTHRPPRSGSPARALLEQFYRVAAQVEAPSPGLAELAPLLGWLSAPAG
jgi:predicted dehydrogenase